MWSVVNFGKWKDKGKTLPQVLLIDPDWFFWAVSEKAFKGTQQKEAETLARRARAIKLPASLAKKHCVQYMFAPDGKFATFNIIPRDQPAHVGSSTESRSPTLSLAAVRDIRKYDKLGSKLLLIGLKYHWFKNQAFTKKRVEAFFDDTSNFVNP